MMATPVRPRPRGCCPRCVDGASGEECTGGLCWDCQGTGHPHLGPCGFWLWWERHASATLMLLIVWLLAAAVPLLALREWIWPAYAYAGISDAWWFSWLAIDVAYQRRFRSKVWNR